MAIDASLPTLRPAEDTDTPKKYPILWVRADSPTPSTGNLIASSIEEDTRITLRAVGAGAINQAVKGIINARQQLAGRGEDLIVRPGFTEIEGNDGKTITAVVFHCFLL